MAKFDKKKFAEQMSKAICDSSELGADHICSVDMSPTYNAETNEWTLDMQGYEFSQHLTGPRGGRPMGPYVPMDTFRLKFSITLIKGESEDEEDRRPY